MRKRRSRRITLAFVESSSSFFNLSLLVASLESFVYGFVILRCVVITQAGSDCGMRMRRLPRATQRQRRGQGRRSAVHKKHIQRERELDIAALSMRLLAHTTSTDLWYCFAPTATRWPLHTSIGKVSHTHAQEHDHRANVSQEKAWTYGACFFERAGTSTNGFAMSNCF